MRRIERWAHQNRLRGRHPVEKLCLAGAMLAASLAVPPVPGGAVIALAMSAVTVLVAGVPLREYLRVVAVPAGFVAGGSLALMVSLDPAGSGWTVAVAPEGASEAARAALRSLAAVSSLSFLALTTPVMDLAGLAGRRRWLAAFAELALVVYRFAHVLTAGAAAMRTAQEARLGYAGAVNAHRSLGLLAASLLPRALGHAARLERGLAVRGYQGSLRTLAEERRVSIPALAALALIVMLALAVALPRGMAPAGGWR